MTPFEMASKLAYGFGCSIIPLPHGQKKPPLVKWEEFKDVPADEDVIEAWDSRNPDANWGLVCGEVSDTIVADSDNEAGEKWILEHLPCTPCVVRGARGFHHYYRWSAEGEKALQHLSKELRDAGIDVDFKMSGGYVVAPGSIHPSGKAYEPQGDFLGMWDFRPEVVVATAEEVDRRERGNVAGIDFTKVEAYAGTLSEGGRNNALTRFAGSLRAQGLSHDDILKELFERNERDCVPPLRRREVAQIAASVCRTHERNHPEPSPAVVEANARRDAEKAYVAERTDMDGLEKVTAEDVRSSDAWPEMLLNPGGLLGEIMDYTLAISPSTSRIYALGGAVALIGAVLSQRVVGPTGLPSSLYTIVVGPSASGKDAPKRAVNLILQRTSAAGIMGPSSVASDVAILSWLKRNGFERALFCIDEIGLFFKATRKKSGPLSRVPEVMLKLFSAYDTKYVHTYADAEKNVDIPWHGFSVLGLSTPEEFWGGMDILSTSNGLLARCLVFEDKEKPAMPVYGMAPEVPMSIIDGIDALRAIPDGTEGVKGNSSATLVPKPHRLGMTASAQEYHDRRSREIHEMRCASPGFRAAQLGRAGELALRVALVAMASRHGAAMVGMDIDLDAMRWSWELVMKCIGDTMQTAESYVHETDFEDWCQRIVRCIRSYIVSPTAKKKGHDGAPKRQISRIVSNIPTVRLDEAIRKLVDQGRLRVETKKARNGRDVELFCLVKDSDDEM